MCNNECLLHEIIDTTYNDIVSVLQSASSLFVPQYNNSFHKFWWDEELKLLKEASVESNQVWKAASKPRHGPIFTKRQSCRMQYAHSLQEKQKLAIVTYTNKLHEALWMDQPSGSVGAPNLSLLANPQKLKAAFITVSLLINLLCILEKNFLLQ